MNAETLQVIAIIIAIIVVVKIFWKISIPRYPNFTDRENEKDAQARKEIKKQLKEERKRAKK